MSLDVIEQNIKSIVENIYSYESLLEKKGGKSDKEIDSIRVNILKLADNIKKLIDKEKSELKNV